MSHLTQNRLYGDIIQLVLGGLLFIAPWLFAFAGPEIVAWNAWVVGAAIVALAIVSLAAAGTQYWASWATLAVGVWAIMAPWALGFAALTVAMWSHLAVGIIVAVLAALELAASQHHVPTVRA